MLTALLQPLHSDAQSSRPDLSGSWTLNAADSDDTESQILGGAGEDRTHGMTHLERSRLLDRLVQLARAIDEIELALTERDLKIYDRDDNVRIYYLDGDERVRQTPWGASLDVVAKWDGQQISVETKGREVGEVNETFGLEGQRLVYIVRIKNPNFENEIVIRNYYDRVD
jgi:hypothetical protein